MTLNRRIMLKATAGSFALGFLQQGANAQTEPFRIGALTPVTGAGSPYGSGMAEMILAAVEEVNLAGGAAGRRLQVFADDDQTNPQSGVLAAKKLIEVNKVNAIMGTWASGVSLAVIPLTNDANVILMHTSGAPALSIAPANAKNFGYRFQATNDRFGRSFAEIVVKEGFKRPATMAFNNASGIGNTQGFKKAWEAKGNKVVAEVVYEPNQPSYRAELQKILASSPDVIVMGSFLPDTTIILREAFQLGAKVKWIIPGWAANPQLIKALGNEATEGVISVDSVSNEQSASFTSFDTAHRKRQSQPGASNVYAAMTYDMVITLALAIEAAGQGADINLINSKIREIANPPGDKVFSFTEGKAALRAKKKINYEGASSVLDFDEFGDVTPDFGVFFITSGQLERRYVVKI